MTECTLGVQQFPVCKRRRVEAYLGGADVTSDGGVLLLRQVGRQLGLTREVAAVLGDARRQASCRHDMVSLLRQRVYALALGYEDLNDHQTLRSDPALQTAVDRDDTLASSPTLCRWENRSDRETAWRLHTVLALLVKRLRQAWPDVEIIFRGDSHMCRWPATAGWHGGNGTMSATSWDWPGTNDWRRWRPVSWRPHTIASSSPA